jgi:hypothetical protein
MHYGDKKRLILLTALMFSKFHQVLSATNLLHLTNSNTNQEKVMSKETSNSHQLTANKLLKVYHQNI